MGAMERCKGVVREQRIVTMHREIGVDAERVPLSGATRYAGRSGDVDLYPFGRDAGALVSEVKARKDGKGFAQLERWLRENDILALWRNNFDPMIVLPWATWVRLLDALKR